MTTLTRNDKKEENLTLFYRTGETYEITINPDDVHQCLKSDDRTRDVYDLVNPIFLKYLKCKWELYTEVSEPDHMNCVGGFPRVHFHGKITLDNVTRFKENLHYLSYMADLKISAYDASYWDEYMTKSVTQITADLGKRYARMVSDDFLPGALSPVSKPTNFFKKRPVRSRPAGPPEELENKRASFIPGLAPSGLERRQPSKGPGL